jgi:hypothetical protein
VKGAATKTDERASRRNFEKLNRQGMNLRQPTKINKENCGMSISQATILEIEESPGLFRRSQTPNSEMNGPTK